MQRANDLKQMIKNDIDSFPSLKPGTETSLGSILFITNFAETVPYITVSLWMETHCFSL